MTKNNTEPKLETAYFHITYACGHRCPSCYLGLGTTRLTDKHVTREKLISIVSKLAEAKVANVCLVGGDPASSANVLPLAHACYEQGLTTSILSNTHDYNGASVQQMAAFVSSFETTFHGSTAQEHDRICGVKGAYDTVVRRLREAHACGTAITAVLNVIPDIDMKLFNTVQALAQREKLPLYAVMFQRIMPFGAACDNKPFALQPATIQNTLDQAAKIQNELGLPVIFEDPLPIRTKVPTGLDIPKRCLWGLSKASIDPHGNVSCCGANPTNAIGNLLDTSLEDLWRTRSSPHLARMRAVKRTCENCPEVLG